MTLPSDIFLSYTRDDQVTARRFAEGLQREGFSVWWDATLRSGEAYDEVTEQALRDAKAVVVLWSKKSVVSRWVRAEATLADRNRTLVPAMIEPCERPIMFELTQTADLSRWTGDSGDMAWRAFVGDVQRFIGGPIPVARNSAQAPAAIAATASPGRDFRPSLAILPFTNRSGDRADDVFADGMVEDLISALSLSREIKVIAQSATIVYRKNTSDLRVIGRDLDVRYLLEGNVRRVGADLRVSAQLVEAETAAILWTQKFDRPLTELAALQELLVIEVAGHLGVQVARVEMERALKKPGDLTAWEAVMRSMANNARITRDGNLTAIKDARKAITIAADYALGHSMLAQQLANFYFTWSGGRDKALAREARAHAERALELDADDPVVLSHCALALGFCGDWHAAQKYALRSFEINPNVEITRMVLCTIALRFTRPDDAIRHATAALVLAPRGQQSYLYFNYQGIAHYQTGRYEQALACVEQALMHNPGFLYAMKDKAICCEKLGRHEAARDAVRRMRAADRTMSLEDIEAVHLASFIAPETAVGMNATLRQVLAGNAAGACGLRRKMRAAAAVPAPPRARLSLGVTGHRDDNPVFTAHRARIETVLEQILDRIAAAVAAEPQSSAHRPAPTRLHCLLAEGADQMAAGSALARGWELVTPLPFGLALNVAINAHPVTAADAYALLADPMDCPDVQDAQVRQRAARITELASRARLFELADRDEYIGRLFLAKLQAPADVRKGSTFAAEISLRAALAARVMIEQSDFLIGIWDGVTRALVGGTGHTIQMALESGASVVWIDANKPEHWRILSGPEALASVQTGSGAHRGETDRDADLLKITRRALRPAAARPHHRRHGHAVPTGPETLALEALPARSMRVWHLYRRIEVLFGADSFRQRFRNLRQTYEAPDAVASGSAAELLKFAGALPGQEAGFAAKIEASVLRRFAWADGVSAQLSDVYRGGMTANFLLSPLAIIGGISYLPFASSHSKWMFALFELLLLAGILAITLTGQKRRWHIRWLETRRVAEYFRHAPILLLLGVARAPGRWPQGTETSWPEWYARNGLREVGLPQLEVTQAYLRAAARDLLQDHVIRQRDYHIAKARRLDAVHHNLDYFSYVLFALAVVSVMGYLTLRAGGMLHLWTQAAADNLSYLFTFFGVLLPTLGGALSGIRFFGDFERFAAISRVTFEKLQAIQSRIAQLLDEPDEALDYGSVADLAHAADEVVVGEIESWQSVFGGKTITVPV